MPIFENKFLQIFLFPLSLLYRFIIFLRNKFYDWQLFKSCQVNCPVLCVGNISVGGTGKTPVVEFLAHTLRQTYKQRVAIVSRGYKRLTNGTVIVTNGQDKPIDVKLAGDEPFLLANHLQDIPIIVDQDRVRGAQFAIDQFQPDYILLDDGFQHRRLARDIDIIVVNALTGFGNKQLLPAGPLRESIKSLKRAHYIWINRIDLTEEVKSLKFNEIQHYKLPIIKADYVPDMLINLKTRQPAALQIIGGKRILAFAGIAFPERFYSTVSQLKPGFLEVRSFRDHHAYSEMDMHSIQEESQLIQADLILTTEKDAVKLNFD
ncbi:tetraacyldisaccharide 4'-kinase, partial [candidate division KSB1 bacterium]|nr:tetraacyldisaccharide 4'-kinase [candidate division KSB1 bacterium]